MVTVPDDRVEPLSVDQPRVSVAEIEWPSWIGLVRSPPSVSTETDVIPPWWDRSGEPVPRYVANALESLLDSEVILDSSQLAQPTIRVDERLRWLVNQLDQERAAQVVAAMFQAVAKQRRTKLHAIARWVLHGLLLFPSAAAVAVIEPVLQGRPGLISDEGRGDITRILAAMNVPEATEAMGRLFASSFPSVRSEAFDWLQAKAHKLGLLSHVLHMSLVPTCGLDVNGVARLDLGPRAFTLVLTDIDQLELRDPAGHPLTAFSVARKTDDPILVERARSRRKEIQAQLAVTSTQVKTLLDEAVRWGRVWPFVDWARLFLGHPVLFHAARGHLWQVDPGTGPELVFRIAEDHTLTDVNDETVQLATLTNVMIVAVLPDSLDASEMGRWMAVLASYKLIRVMRALQGELRHARPIPARVQEDSPRCHTSGLGAHPCLALQCPVKHRRTRSRRCRCMA